MDYIKSLVAEIDLNGTNVNEVSRCSENTFCTWIVKARSTSHVPDKAISFPDTLRMRIGTMFQLRKWEGKESLHMSPDVFQGAEWMLNLFGRVLSL